MVDVVIAGGGIAGSALAIFLGRRGFEVEIFDRAQFPREKPCGEGLMPAGVAVLERLGLAEAVGGHAAARLGADEAWLLEFEHERQAMLRDYFALTDLVLWLSEHPRLCEGVFAAIAHVPRVFSHFIGVAAGMRKFLGPVRPITRVGCLRTAAFDLNDLQRMCVSEGKSAGKRK